MKAFLTLTTLLLTVALASANWHCGNGQCGNDELCWGMDNNHHCMKLWDCHDVSLQITCIGTWVDAKNGRTYSQFDVTIHNHMGRNIKQIFIGTDHTLCLRDNNSIWNVVRCNDNQDLTLPNNVDVNAHASYTFGFIVEGRQEPHLWVKAVTF
ncbi:cellulose-binding domain-containing protein [Tieghemostelium lacteum]|uniref:Cellulose-binding domain-containing protein n=1 Tax=Tieghemostelium lacteum TaxID=361077 RepID=A0A152A3A0_TIELA|nr:cellulose-binding domain-containing protein [Tieghemostelium lacteum]|eukprot:KYR00521.1 cellulose-binding domain-containing protein [Tieghemostelium lacteum]